MAKPDRRTLRCAIYTRKSSEEGLEQEFNSLDAQREACEAYIRSQRHEGWVLLPASYDDGGFSGGSLERPAVQRLLADVRSGRVDVIVVYKVDRLTRALADFARLVETFDAANVSFVSVTQQFNTTTSMGRLTLNVLLSFAQFEREVTGERIRDKIAASKQKGLWMGGYPPLGYTPNGRTLLIHETEAETVRTLFALYLELGSVRLLKAEVDRRGIVSKRWVTATGKAWGGKPKSRGALYHLLSNPLYIGRIVHRGTEHPGQHPAIIDPDTWARVQAQLKTGARRDGPRSTESSLLVGKLFDSAGSRLTPSHALKNGKRYRYYVTPDVGASSAEGWRLPAHGVEALVVRTIAQALDDPSDLLAQLEMLPVGADAYRQQLDAARQLRGALTGIDPEAAPAIVDALVERVVLDRTEVAVHLSVVALTTRIGAHQPEQCGSGREPRSLILRVPVEMRRCGVETRFVIPGAADRASRQVDPALVKAVARGRLWFDQIATGAGQSIAALAAQKGVTPRYVSRLLPLAFLAPDIVERILDGRQPIDLTAEALTRSDSLPFAWSAQRRLLRS